MPKILSISYDLSLLRSRESLLNSLGYYVTSVSDSLQALKHCAGHEHFDVLVLGHSIPHTQKEELVEAFRANRPRTPIIALKRIGEEPVRGADLLIEPNPGELLRSVAMLTSARGTAA